MTNAQLSEVWYDPVDKRVVLPPPERTSRITKRLALVVGREVYLVEKQPVSPSEESGFLVAVSSMREEEDRRFNEALKSYLDDVRKMGPIGSLKANHEGVATASHPSWYDPEVDRPPAGVLMNLLTVGGREVEGYWREGGGFIAWSPKMKVPAWAKERMQQAYQQKPF